MSIQSDFEGYRRPFRQITPVTEMELVRKAQARRLSAKRKVLLVAGITALLFSLWILSGVHL